MPPYRATALALLLGVCAAHQRRLDAQVTDQVQRIDGTAAVDAIANLTKCVSRCLGIEPLFFFPQRF